MQTASVFRALAPGLIENPRSATVFLAKYLSKEGSTPFFNRLQVTAEALEPGLREVREEGERVFGVPFTLTGSGSSYFGEISGTEDAPARDGWVTRGGLSVEVRAVRTI
jgi:4-diphosphocytidyl-2C-methyl-D-erythritol kinase